MKKLRDIKNRFSSVSTAAGVMIATALAISFWFATAPKAMAVDCQVCHKNSVTLTLECGSLDWRRHIDHGDAPNACQVTGTQNP